MLRLTLQYYKFDIGRDTLLKLVVLLKVSGRDTLILMLPTSIDTFEIILNLKVKKNTKVYNNVLKAIDNTMMM